MKVKTNLTLRLKINLFCLINVNRIIQNFTETKSLSLNLF